MASYLIDKLEELKEDEIKLKEQQRILMEEIELDIEKRRRLELDGTIIKLWTQVEDFTKNIEGEIMPDNLPLLREQENTDYIKASNKVHSNLNQGLIDNGEAKKQIKERRQERDKKFLQWNNREYSNGRTGMDTKITLEKFKDNLGKVRQETKDRHNRLGQSNIEIPPEIKIYDDIIPIFTTMIGIMKKQEFEIDNLKKKMEDHVHFVL